MKKKLIKKLKDEVSGRIAAMVYITAEEAELIISALNAKPAFPLSKSMIEALEDGAYTLQELEDMVKRNKIKQYPPIELKNLKNPE